MACFIPACPHADNVVTSLHFAITTAAWLLHPPTSANRLLTSTRSSSRVLVAAFFNKTLLAEVSV
jgi:hypothetical protein